MEKHHEHLFKTIENHYYFLADRVPVRQDALFKTYLWSASLALALNLSLLPKLLAGSLWFGLSVCSVMVAFVVLMFALNAMRGKATENLKTPDFRAYLSYLDSPEYNTPLIARTLANDMTDCFNHQREIQNLRGLRLRAMSRLLLLAFALLLLASSGVAFK